MNFEAEKWLKSAKDFLNQANVLLEGIRRETTDGRVENIAHRTMAIINQARCSIENLEEELK